jgi:hypothetical protein
VRRTPLLESFLPGLLRMILATAVRIAGSGIPRLGIPGNRFVLRSVLILTFSW